ncbi:MAG: hypothetical protein QXU01_01230 [Candidatus Hadarchaeales archaeon]
MASEEIRPPPEFPLLKEVRAILESERTKKTTVFEKICKFAHRIFGKFISDYKLSPQTAVKLKEAGINITGGEWLAGFLFFLLLPILSFFIFWILSPSLVENFHILILGFLLAGFSALIFLLYPEARASSLAAKAQTDAVITVSIMAFSLYHRPDLNGALVRAAEATDGALAREIRLGLLQMKQQRKYGSLRQLLTDIADRWGKANDSIGQSLFDILRSSGTISEEARVSDVMKAPVRVLEGSEEQLSTRLNSLILPTIAFLTFGSLLIVATIGLSPVLGVLGLSFIDLKFYVGLAAFLVVVFLAFTLYLSAKRPSTIHPIVLETSWENTTGGVMVFRLLIPFLVFITLSLPGIFYLLEFRVGLAEIFTMSLSTLWIVLASGVSISLYGYLGYSTLLEAREKERKRIADWENALNIMGSKMLDGKSAARAMIETAELMRGELSSDLKLAGERMEKIGAGMEHCLRKNENPLIRNFISVISSLRRESEIAAGRACMIAAEFIHMLRKTEKRFREKINDVLGNLWMISIILVPIVCAMSVWVMDVVSGMRLSVTTQMEAAGVSWYPFMLGIMETKELAILRLIMGTTAILISVIIAWFISTIKSPGDKVELWLSISKSSLLSSIIFVLSTLLLALISPAMP